MLRPLTILHMGQAKPLHAGIPDNQKPAHAQRHYAFTVHECKAASIHRSFLQVIAAAPGRCSTEVSSAGSATAASWLLLYCWGLKPHDHTGNAAVHVVSDS